MNNVEERLAALGLDLSRAKTPVANYLGSQELLASSAESGEIPG